MNVPHMQRQAARGFTLLEILIALAMLAIVLSAAFRGISLAASQATELGERHLAQWVAQNRLAEAHILTPFPDVSRSNGEVTQGGYRFRWEQEVKATDNPLLRRIDVRVLRAEDGAQLSKLTGVAMRP
jgi:general secretion pathway protein I